MPLLCGYRHRIGKELIKKKNVVLLSMVSQQKAHRTGAGIRAEKSLLKLTSGSSQTEREEGQRGGGQ